LWVVLVFVLGDGVFVGVFFNKKRRKGFTLHAGRYHFRRKIVIKYNCLDFQIKEIRISLE